MFTKERNYLAPILNPRGRRVIYAFAHVLGRFVSLRGITFRDVMFTPELLSALARMPFIPEVHLHECACVPEVIVSSPIHVGQLVVFSRSNIWTPQEDPGLDVLIDAFMGSPVLHHFELHVPGIDRSDNIISDWFGVLRARPSYYTSQITTMVFENTRCTAMAMRFLSCFASLSNLYINQTSNPREVMPTNGLPFRAPPMLRCSEGDLTYFEASPSISHLLLVETFEGISIEAFRRQRDHRARLFQNILHLSVEKVEMWQSEGIFSAMAALLPNLRTLSMRTSEDKLQVSIPFDMTTLLTYLPC
jgi:hypothetical protein